MAWLDAIWKVILWWLEGLLGCLFAAARMHTDVPPLQCLVSGLTLAGLGAGIELLIQGIRRRRKRRQWAKERLYDDPDQ